MTAMHVEFGPMLFYLIVHVTVVHRALGVFACIGTSNSSRRGHFHAFQTLPPTNEHAYGCASDVDLAVDGDSRHSHKEIHVINVENDGAVDIYLNIDGIHNEKTKTLPRKEYEYEFTLLSKEDVIWVISTENLPGDGVALKVYCSPGSRVVFRDGRKLSPVNVAFDDAKHMSSQNILNSCRKDNLFQQITSFTEVSAAKVASVNVLVGVSRDALFSLAGNFTDCSSLEASYISPVVSVGHYEANLPLLSCGQIVSAEDVTNRNEAFVVDVEAKPVAGGRTQIINLEIVGTEPAGSEDRNAAKKRLVVLKSLGSCEWHVHLERNLDVSDFMFVVGKNSKLVHGDTSRNAEAVYESLDYDKDDEGLTSVIETLYDSTVVAYSRYNADAALIFLKLADADARFFDRDSLLDKAHDIFRQSTLSPCADHDWFLDVPIRVLKQYGLTEKDLELSSMVSKCQVKPTDQNLHYVLTECSAASEDGVYVNMRVTFRVKTSSHLFTVPGGRFETRTIRLPRCRGRQVPVYDPGVSNVATDISRSCAEGLFILKIPNNVLAALDSTRLSNCDHRTVDDSTEFAITNDGVSTCGAVFEEGVTKIEIQKKPKDDGSQPEPVKISCSYSTEEASINYRLRVFQDFNLRKQLRDTELVTHTSEDSDETTYHFQVLGASSDPSLAVFLSRCSLKENFDRTRLLIRNNCPTTDSVSFVRSTTKFANRAQHFAVKIGQLLIGDGLHDVECEVSACTLEPCDRCIPSVPQCMHLQGDGCMESSANKQLRIAPYLQDTVSSAVRFKLQAYEIDTPAKPGRFDGKDGEIRKAENSKSALTFGIPIVVTLTLVAFIIGFAFFGMIALTHSRFARGKRGTAARSESKRSRESGGSRGAGFTGITRNSFSSLLCLKTEKSSSLTSSKDGSVLEQKPFIKSNPSTLATNQPQKPEAMFKKKLESSRGNGRSGRISHARHGGAANGKTVQGPIASTLPVRARIKTSSACLAVGASAHNADVHVHMPGDGRITPQRPTSRTCNDPPLPFFAQGTSHDTIAGRRRHGTGGQCAPPVVGGNLQSCPVLCASNLDSYRVPVST